MKITHTLVRKTSKTVLAIGLIATQAFGSPQPQQRQEIPDRVLVKLRNATNVADTATEGRIRTRMQNVGAQELRRSKRGFRVIQVTAANKNALVQQLKADPTVEMVEPDYVARAIGIPNDPQFSSQWHHPKIRTPQAWDVTIGSSSVVVAVIDTGVSSTHPDLAGKILPGYDFVNRDSDAADDQGHGTAVAGVVAAYGNNARGVAGVNWSASILPVKVLDRYGSGSYSDVAEGIIYAADRGAKIINLSLGGSDSSFVMQDAITYAVSKGCLVVCAAGNAGSSQPMYPGACNGSFAVSATDSNDQITNWSSFGNHVSISAPGLNILTTTMNGSYATVSGTSFSSPIVAGVASLVLGVRPTFTASQVANVLTTTSDDIGTAGRDQFYGFGRINAEKAVRSAAGVPTPNPTPVPTPNPTPAPTPEPGDSVPPQVGIVKPFDKSELGYFKTVNVTVASTDNVQVSRVVLYVNNRAVYTSNIPNFVWKWNTAALPENSTHVIYAVAYDTAGNNSVSEVVTVTKLLKKTNPW